MIDEDDSDALFQLVGRYGEDFQDFYGNDVRAAFDEYALGRSFNARAEALTDIDRVLEMSTSEADLQHRLDRIGLARLMPWAGCETYREFMLMLRGWLVESLETIPVRPEPIPWPDEPPWEDDQG
jgi:hypothetical protein